MSQEFLLIRKRRFIPDVICRVLLFVGVKPLSLGTVESVKEKVSEIFPHISWECRVNAQSPSNEDSASITEMDMKTWMGLGLPEFMVIPDEEDICRVSTLWVSNVDRPELRLLEKRLRLVSFDMQQGILRMLLGGKY